MLSRRFLSAVLMCTLLTSFVIPLLAQDQQTKKIPDTSAAAELYQQHCAVCHGSDLKGAGPFPPPYRTPPDLTKLARRHGGRFPRGYVAKILKQGVTLPAHGPAEMPVWGPDFVAKEHMDEAQVAARIRRLVNYIESVQEK
jgi:mono/diheme cytochrome c family protein